MRPRVCVRLPPPHLTTPPTSPPYSKYLLGATSCVRLSDSGVNKIIQREEDDVVKERRPPVYKMNPAAIGHPTDMARSAVRMCVRVFPGALHITHTLSPRPCCPSHLSRLLCLYRYPSLHFISLYLYTPPRVLRSVSVPRCV